MVHWEDRLEQLRALNMSASLRTYGNILALFSSFEFCVEIVVMRRLRLTPVECHTIMAGITVETKIGWATALLKLAPENWEGAKKLVAVRQVAERNTLAHGLFRVDRSNGHLSLLKRTREASGLKVSLKEIDPILLDAHLEEFASAYRAVEQHFGISDADFEAYTAPLIALLPGEPPPPPTA